MAEKEYIEREAAIEAMYKDAEAHPEHTFWVTQHEALRSIPAADVRPVVRGRWIPIGTDDMDEGMFKCSECGSEHFFPEILLGIPADNFCPNCGADMRPTSMSGAKEES